MIEVIHKYITENIGRWHTPPSVSCPDIWKPIFCSNHNYDVVREYPIITRLIFWVEGGRLQLATKIVDKSLSLESIQTCQNYQRHINKRLGYDLFPPLYDIADIGGRWVLFEPAIQGATYGTELTRTIFSPEASMPYLGRVFTRQFAEMGELFADLLKLTSPGTKHWGQTFYDLGANIEAELKDGYLHPEHLEIMKHHIDSFPIQNTPVLADLATQNIFPSARLVDNIIPDIKGLNESLPGIINAFRFMAPIFYSPPVSGIVEKGWIHAQASALMDTEEDTLLAKPVRDLCRKIGFNMDEPAVIWAFIMGATFFEMATALDFYKNSPFEDMKKEYSFWMGSLAAVQMALERGEING